MTIKTTIDKALARLFTRFPALVRVWAKSHEFAVQDQPPWAPLSKKLITCRVALVTTAGVHLKAQVPFDMADREGDPTYREIPSNTDARDLVITHNYYDHRDADRDINVVFPIDRLRDLAGNVVGASAPRHLSFMGHILGSHIHTLIAQTAPRAASLLKEDGTDVVFLTPA